MVRDTDSGKKIKEDIEALKMLLRAYREGSWNRVKRFLHALYVLS